ncbi:hypothetical protein F1737_06435 [Methanoplanus sp. FWC-SCC4]|uniref:MrpA C-terminal/MbhE domain-containing protein n=1 Tax=Methanochimaera problematica TaxID=2609417 RepID=A0AA97FDP8_9EURY|nr:hydrogen gas-evolving membrane-bound hydrogenase subunit E [Methanoplanus sp. FWC-SCC4]WOF16368.1 hypothetical protein F1737_06435 [Methanoplanus sp. FWC-SCC4]
MRTKDIATALIVAILAASFLMTAVDLEFGSPKNTGMDDYMIQNGQEMAAVNNIVTGVVFDFRGFDTLGEATVLFTAVLAISMMFRKRKEEDEDYDYE